MIVDDTERLKAHFYEATKMKRDIKSNISILKDAQLQ